jgi:hypothetical protein
MRRFLPLLLAALPFSTFAADPAPRWWKGNLHTHSHWSDGDDYPEMIADWYKGRGYHFLALSDHNILSDHERWISIAKSKGAQLAFDKYLAKFGPDWVEQRTAAGDKEVRLKTLGEFRPKFDEPGKFLMVQSEEISGRFLTAPIHINVTNVRECIMPLKGNSVTETIQKTLDAVAEQRRRTGVPMFAHINHPNFGWALTAEEMMNLEGDRFFEVYNGHPMVHNEGDGKRAGTERIWDILLTERLAELGKPAFFGLATDDSHNYHNDPKKLSRSGRGWVMVRAAKLTVEDLIAAMEAGDFYATSGVTLRDVKRTREGIVIEVEPETGITYTIDFIGTRKGYDRNSTPVTGDDGATMRTTRQYSADIGKVLTSSQGPSASYRLKGDEIYVRGRITSSKVKADPYREGEVEMAWTQPLVTGVK